MNKGAVASELPDAHSRAVHCITQNKGSMFSAQAPDSYNLFLTSAVTDGVKIWDLRTLRSTSASESCQQASLSRRNSSEMKRMDAYVYDIRSSSYLHKLQKHSETVLSVAFNPSTPERAKRSLLGGQTANTEVDSVKFLPSGPECHIRICLSRALLMISTHTDCHRLAGWQMDEQGEQGYKDYPSKKIHHSLVLVCLSHPQTSTIVPPFPSTGICLLLLTGTLDGKLRLFHSSSGARLSHETSAAVHSVPPT
ncbi:hypothetical protein PAMP_001794 [Pampus punctatissimus]